MLTCLTHYRPNSQHTAKQNTAAVRNSDLVVESLNVKLHIILSKSFNHCASVFDQGNIHAVLLPESFLELLRAGGWLMVPVYRREKKWKSKFSGTPCALYSVPYSTHCFHKWEISVSNSKADGI